jgi:DNA-binding response OmpR family regulator
MTAGNEDAMASPPCLILAHADPAYAAQAGRAFRRLGWDVYAAPTGPGVRRLARMLAPDLVVLDADLPGETGWLTCAKLHREWPGLKVVLVADTLDEGAAAFAAFVGAAGLVHRQGGVAALLPHADSDSLPAAG